MAELPRKLAWHVAEVVETSPDTPRTKSLFLEVPDWEGHRAGQHVDVRLTAEDGYQAERSYSIASAPEDGRVELLVERLEDGEVSPYLTDELRGRRRAGVAGSDRGLVRLGDEGGRALASRRRRIRHSAAHGDDPTPPGCKQRRPRPPALLHALLRRHHLPRRPRALRWCAVQRATTP